MIMPSFPSLQSALPLPPRATCSHCHPAGFDPGSSQVLDKIHEDPWWAISSSMGEPYLPPIYEILECQRPGAPLRPLQQPEFHVHLGGLLRPAWFRIW
jgi:hypothetical protein